MIKKPTPADSSATLNKLRAAVLGANDGIVSTSSVLMGVAGATHNKGAIFTAGMAALVAGALSMAVGEYVSVSSQSDAQKGKVAEDEISSPIAAAVSSLVAFTLGGLIPFLTIVSLPKSLSLWGTGIAVFIALLLTGYLSAYFGGAPKTRAIVRVVVGGILAMIVTFYVGRLFGTRVA